MVPDATQKVCGFPSARTPPIQPFAPFRVMLPHALLSPLPHSSSFKHFPLLLAFTFLPNLGQPPPVPPPSDASFYPVCSQWSCQGRVRCPFARGRGRSESLLLDLSFPYSSTSFFVIIAATSSERRSKRSFCWSRKKRKRWRKNSLLV